QQRRQKRMVRRQLRRRRARRKLLNDVLAAADFLPAFGSEDWPRVMAIAPYDLRVRGLSKRLEPHEVGRALYHLAQRRHFRGRDLDDSGDTSTESAEGNAGAEASDEKETAADRESTLNALRDEGITLGTLLSRKGPHDRRRCIHAHRDAVREEFERLWSEQAKHHPAMGDGTLRLKEQVEDAIFAQRPVFWRRNTLGECRFMPGEQLCPKGAWLSQQRRMLEKLNNLELATGNLRPLDGEERAAILEKLQTQAAMTWGGVRAALKPLYKARGEAGAEKRLKFNLELGGERKLLGNPLEAKLASIFGDEWTEHPRKQEIRNAVHERLWSADYGEIGTQRVVILPTRDREARRAKAAQSFVDDFDIKPEQAEALGKLQFPTGWEPYSTRALRAILPRLEDRVRFGALINGPDWEDWRDETFPERDRPTGEVFDRLPSPACPDESRRIAGLRNPTVVRVQNELRKVVNNLIGLYGKPDLIRIELAREVGKSKRERDEIRAGIRRNERQRKEAAKDLESKRISEPSRDMIEKWLLWKESGERCPYTGDQIGFDDLFREGRYEVEHIWPRSRSFDDSFFNKTLCRKDVNIEKSNRIPYEYFQNRPDNWADVQRRVQSMVSARGGPGMKPAKIRRFLAEKIPEDFAGRQLNDTGYAARQAVAFLNRLWPDVGPEAPVRVEAVTGRVTAQLRKLWGLNNILSDDGEKTRADHRHHAIDALTVACAHPGMTNRLSRYWQAKDDPRAQRPDLPPPWPTIRADAEKQTARIVVSHRVRKKVSGPLHKETVYGDTRQDVVTQTGEYRQFVTRKRLETLTKDEIWPRDERDGIRDSRVRKLVQDWVSEHGGDPKKAFPPYPRLGKNGREIRKVRLLSKQQLSLMAPVGTGYADKGANHHIAIYRGSNGKAVFEVVSLFEAAQRLSRREPIVRRTRDDGAVFVMSLAPGDTIEFLKEGSRDLLVVQGVWASGVIVTLDHRDAVGSSIWRPSAGSIVAANARKVTVDPIGRIRPAND
ncbi:MAG: type II CRISPR RNA-guided endonuclease Cas9, partial [Rhodospirillales bacterium]|nr:type II CRISPR RNA-guided endonuclease Cas9 [Rhodospirillales bacterium]